jgi:hypothetical protein
LGQYGTRSKTECAAIFLQINQSGRRKPAITGELTMHAHVYKGKNRMKPSLVDLIGAVIGFAGLAVFLFLCLAY